MSVQIVQVAEIVRELICVLRGIVQLPREQKKEWIRILDSIIHGSEGLISVGCMGCAWKGLACPTDLCPECEDALEII